MTTVGEMIAALQDFVAQSPSNAGIPVKVIQFDVEGLGNMEDATLPELRECYYGTSIGRRVALISPAGEDG